MNTQRHPLWWTTLGVVLGVFLSYNFFQVRHNPIYKRQNSEGVLKFGNPGPVNDLFERHAYTVSYNRRDRIPYWVGEHLTVENLQRGNGVSRDKSRFKEDSELPDMFRAFPKDYTGSGYDRGHMAPAADAVATQTEMDETFLMSNIAPQVGPGFNRDYWAFLEKFCRDITHNFTDVYVYSGPLFLPRVNRNTHALGETGIRFDGRGIMSEEIVGATKLKYEMTYDMIGTNGPSVAVPTHFFKVLLALKDGQYLSGAFVLPNQAINRGVPLTQFQMDLRAIERASGLQFFQELDRRSFLNLCDHILCSV
ncbi:hypothetical protein BCV72DRAFT_54045 [Rhizopus microsporus var. microsporus]|uniref:Endonuclease n=2 Tax=Rhizopus microsporus TaxID=58291 RepID=A0A2G4SVZ6_RHIZD|nr:uncharacterized protein RHIMIDRAFT_236949 [Rhizopus microsporus ATCC 52813]ORE02336.1 hypothetical protein BCV72DRAFT_54045 [Rhizopus microsporus var. microsporus]PHZ12914.1 hypothetical protein RHIMIDRAFT_236949 [Rhizopus microsporus ATCC 52813]